jgi:hypothetical protein
MSSLAASQLPCHGTTTRDGQCRYLIQRKQNGADGNSFTYEAGPNATDELEPNGGIDAYVDRVRSELFTCVVC